MYQIALYNMNSADRSITRTLLERYSNYTDTKLSITNFETGFDLLSSINVYHVAIVDISDSGENILKNARAFLDKNPYARLILISDSHERYPDGFRVGAHRFFVKPLKADRFFSDMEEIFNQISLNLTTIRIDEKIDESIPIDSILYAESHNRNVKFYTDKGIIESKETFSYWHDYFMDSDIILCYRGCLVNLKHVETIGRTTIQLHDGTNIPVSRRLHNSVTRKYESYIKRHTKKDA